MEDFVDHYIVLGLPSEGVTSLSEKEIAKAYKFKALELHPDKRPDDPDAHEKFQKLKTSYEILKDEKARKLFDDLLRVKREKQQRQSQVDSKRRKMMSDLEERERSAFVPGTAARAHDEEERISRKLKEEIDRIRAKHAKKSGAPGTPGSGVDGKRKDDGGSAGVGVQLDKERVLKVSWEILGEGYTAERLREVFSEFGDVEDVVIRSTKKKGSALVVMATKDGAVAAMGTLCGHLSNPLLVVPLQRAAQTEFPTVEKSAEAEPRSNIVGAGYQAYEDAVLQKLRKGRSVEVRQAAGLLLKNNLRAAYASMAPENQRYIKSELLPCLGAADRQIRTTVGTIVSVIVQLEGVSGWPELLPALVNCLDSKDLNHMEGTMDALSKVCEDVPQVLDSEVPGLAERPINIFLPRLFQFLQSPHTSFEEACLRFRKPIYHNHACCKYIDIITYKTPIYNCSWFTLHRDKSRTLICCTVFFHLPLIILRESNELRYRVVLSVLDTQSNSFCYF